MTGVMDPAHDAASAGNSRGMAIGGSATGGLSDGAFGTWGAGTICGTVSRGGIASGLD